MIKESYCSYEIYKLLREKGFDGEIHTTYDDEGYTQPSITHQIACAWLREKHLIHVYAEYKAFFQERPKKLYYHWIPFIKTLPHCPINKSGFPKDTICINEFYDTYEEATKASLKYVLENLI